MILPFSFHGLTAAEHRKRLAQRAAELLTPEPRFSYDRWRAYKAQFAAIAQPPAKPTDEDHRKAEHEWRRHLGESLSEGLGVGPHGCEMEPRFAASIAAFALGCLDHILRLDTVIEDLRKENARLGVEMGQRCRALDASIDAHTKALSQLAAAKIEADQLRADLTAERAAHAETKRLAASAAEHGAALLSAAESREAAWRVSAEATGSVLRTLETATGIRANAEGLARR